LERRSDDEKSRKHENPEREVSPERPQSAFRALRGELNEIAGDNQHGNNNQNSK
jgi:hypothetical protein